MTAVVLSVKVIVRDRSGRVLLLRRATSCAHNAGKWEFPGGRVESGEAFDRALRRKVKEETGLEITIAGSFDTSYSNLPE